MPALHASLSSLAEDAALETVLAAVMVLFATLPQAVIDGRYEDVLRTHELLSVPALRLLQLRDLIALGVPYGHGMQLMHALAPAVDAQVAALPQVAYPVQSAQTAQRAARPSTRLRFAETGRNGSIDLRSWKAFIFAFVALLRSMDLTPELVDLAYNVALHPALDLPDGYNVQDPQNAVLFDVVLLLDGGVPPDMLLSVPPEILERRQGIELLQFFSSRILSQSDASIGVLESWFSDPTPCKAKSLTVALVEWQRVVDQLIAHGAGPSDVAMNNSLAKLVSKIQECQRAFEAL